MWMMLNHYTPDDFVIASGETHSIRGFCEYVFSKLNLNYSDYVTINEKFLRKEELPYLRGDAYKAKLILDWTPEYSFEDTINEMITYWQEELG
jgi:GDPmannose 4,6-dehydratase